MYQKPATTFIGQGWIGVESMQHRGVEWVVCFPDLGAPLGLTGAFFFSSSDSAKTALQTVAGGQVAENLLDFGYEPAQEGLTGLAATQVLQEPAAKSIHRAHRRIRWTTSFRYLGARRRYPELIPLAAPAIDPLGGFGGISPPAATPATPSNSNQQEDLLGLF